MWIMRSALLDHIRKPHLLLHLARRLGLLRWIEGASSYYLEELVAYLVLVHLRELVLLTPSFLLVGQLLLHHE